MVCSAFAADIWYPRPFIFFLTQLSQKFTNTHHFRGPPTDPCLTPLPCLNGSVSLPWARETVVVAPPPSATFPWSRFMRMSIICCGSPRALQDMAWLQYSMESNALLRSVTRMLSSWFEAIGRPLLLRLESLVGCALLFLGALHIDPHLTLCV